MQITLDRLLASREARRDRQQQWLAEHPGCTLVCLTVQLPGAVKRSPASLIVGGAGMAALLGRFGGGPVEVRDLETGYEAYLAVPAEARQVKRICCELEDTHPLGRLMDIDVLEAGDPAPLGRESLGLAPRRCLLCDRPARYCMRSHAHTREELLDRIREMIDAYAG